MPTDTTSNPGAVAEQQGEVKRGPANHAADHDRADLDAPTPPGGPQRQDSPDGDVHAMGGQNSASAQGTVAPPSPDTQPSVEPSLPGEDPGPGGDPASDPDVPTPQPDPDAAPPVNRADEQEENAENSTFGEPSQ